MTRVRMHPGRSWRIGAMVAIMALALIIVATLLAGASSSQGHGAEGTGDPYFPSYGNGGYHVSHYGVDVAYAPSAKRLTGRTTITATSTQKLTRFDLDFVLHVSSVTVDGHAATFRQYTVTAPKPSLGGELVVTPRSMIRKNAPMTVVVKYADTPLKVKVAGFTPWVQSPTGAAVLGQAESAAWWYPSNDHPSDKATYDITITAPSRLKALSNGVKAGTTTSGPDTTTRWRVDQPMATYLAFMAIGDYRITTSHLASGIPYTSAVEEGGGATMKRAAAALAETPAVLSWLEKKYGPYPFDAAGGVVIDKNYGVCCGLENQTRPVYPNSYWRRPSKTTIIVHENTHQWFGDSVTVKDWKDIWLNEGPAFYTEWLWTEEHGGVSAQSQFDRYYKEIPAGDPFWKVRIDDPGARKIFADAIYVRSAMTLHALKNKVGSKTFFTIMRTWVQSRRHGNGDTPEFIRLASKTSGQDLATFFAHWTHSDTKPADTTANGFPDDR